MYMPVLVISKPSLQVVLRFSTRRASSLRFFKYLTAMWKQIPKKSIGEGVVGCELLRAQRSYGAALDPPALQNQPTAF